MIWQDYRAPLVLIAILVLLAGVIVYRVVRSQMNPEAALICFALYWLSPWRLANGAMMWEPAFLFLPAALHLWATSRLQTLPQFGASIVLGVVLLLIPQIHGSFLFLWLLTAILLYKREIRLDWRGFVLGAIIGSLSLLPAIAALVSGNFPPVMPQDGFIGKGFVTVWPVFKGAIYWLRLGSLDCGAIKEVVYFDRGWATTYVQYATLILLRIAQALTIATIAFSILATWWYYRKRKIAVDERVQTSWIERYAWYGALALTLSAGFSPVTLQSWHVVIALPAALIPLAIWTTRRVKTNRKLFALFVLYIALGVASVVAIGMGKGAFRKVALPHEVESLPAVRSLFPPGLPIEAP